MKKTFVRSELEAGNVAKLRKLGAKASGKLALPGLLFLVAEALDAAIDGDNAYLTIGLSRDRTAILATVSWDGAKAYAAGEDILTLSASCWELTSEADIVSDALNPPPPRSSTKAPP